MRLAKTRGPGCDQVDKTVIFAVAGAGKTTEIVNRLDPAKRTLIFTYTEENLLNLRRKLVETHGAVPNARTS